MSTPSHWPRPVPLVGDRSSASERAADIGAWAFPDPAIDAVHDVIHARRDIRRFRPDALPAEVLDEILAAGHVAPSVGHSQPWRFVVIRSPQTRARAARMADAERLRQAALLDPDSARGLLDLQLEGIREAPVGVVVCCDRRAPAGGILGRATFTDTDLWSCACAIQNMWITARAHGLGLGWVTLFEPSELTRLIGAPEGVATLGWLCLGWPDERPPAPGLERAGWSTRQPLHDVVLEEHWPAGTAPHPPASRLAVSAPDPEHVVSVRDDADELLTPAGSLGVLDRTVDRVIAAAGPDANSGRLILVGADHPVTRHGVSTFPSSVTRDVLSAAVAGTALGAAAAIGAGLDVTVVDAGVDGPVVSGCVDARPRGVRGDLADTDALTAADVELLLERGRELGNGAGGGLVILGEVGVGNSTVAAALAAALLQLSSTDVTGLGAGGDSGTMQRKSSVIDAVLRRLPQPHRSPVDPRTALAVTGGPEFAVLVGVILGACAGGNAVVLDGLATSVAALLAVRLEPGVAAFLVAGQRSRERAHSRVLIELGLEPLLDLRIRAGEGAGAVLATSLILQALRLRRATARTAP